MRYKTSPDSPWPVPGAGQGRKPAKCIAVLGTGSDVGKSVLAAGLCRIFKQLGYRVAPFKAQNMSNNSGVTPEGLEMGRAQIVQAEACGLAPHVDMNPVLLKPSGEMGSQVVLLGRVYKNSTAREYYQQKADLEIEARAALDRLRQEYDLVVMEGAGSCAEVNLMEDDFVNLRMAEYAQADVVLAADIHRGGVFAQIVGTLACLDGRQLEMIKGFIINRFRGDVSLFGSGVDWIEQKTGKPVLGVVPWYQGITIEAEDSVVLERSNLEQSFDRSRPCIAVVRLPHVSNFTDFHSLARTPEVSCGFLEEPGDLSRFQAVILPGSKNTRADLDWLRHSGWAEEIDAFARDGGHVLGICGGYQMLGHAVDDPEGLEGPAGSTPGLGLLPVRTRLQAPKTTSWSEFSWGRARGCGYEIHMGCTEMFGKGLPLLEVVKRNRISCQDADGCISADGRILGCYMHGFFDEPQILAAWLRGIGVECAGSETKTGWLQARQQEYDRLAEHLRTSLDLKKIVDLARTDSQR
ncbi:MAG: cobyric acid synthase [Desulfohalobiaceae bacterium]|nr:cobyric acid synthase [Desulfohalobiaceae bacterium]